jgi:uncharacterized membrane protein
MAPTTRTPIPPKRLHWLGEQVDAWRADGIVDDEQAAAIRDRYVPDTRTSLARLALALGATFLGVGVLWLVATNLDYDTVSPAMRFAVAAVLWLGFTAAGATVRGTAGGPLRLLAALLFGAVVFQTAQSLNVPAYEPSLLLAWSGGALALAYGTRSTAPLAVGVGTGLGWYFWTLLDVSPNAAAFVAGLALATPVLAAVAVAHGVDRMAVPWLRCACATGLVALFAASLPGLLPEHERYRKPVYAGAAVALVALVAAAARVALRPAPEARFGFPELGGSAALAAAALAVAASAPGGGNPFDAGELSGGALAHALVASGLFVAAAVAVAAVGVARELPGLVNLAAVLLVLFVTLQSFGLFAPLLSGAGLFLLVGALLVGSGVLVDRGRRRLHEEING